MREGIDIFKTQPNAFIRALKADDYAGNYLNLKSLEYDRFTEL